MRLNLPIVLTWSRVLAIPLLIGVYYLPDAWLDLHETNLTATLVFTLAALTDWADGWLARRFNQVSAFGAFLDPVADKLMIAAALILLVELERTSALIAVIIIGREIAVSALREWMAQIGSGHSVTVSMVGKIKTTAQMLAIPMLLYHDPLFGIPVQRAGYWLLLIAALLTLCSMVFYLHKAWPEISKRYR